MRIGTSFEIVATTLILLRFETSKCAQSI